MGNSSECWTREVRERDELERTIDWKQGLAISIGVPLLILPSIGYFTSWLWAFAIIAWGLSVLQGFAQNLAYSELATAFPDASGIPGYAQAVFKNPENTRTYDVGKLNAHGTPVVAMVVIALFNMAMISFKTPTAILGASVIGYICTNGISLFAYVKVKRDPYFASLDRSFRAPAGWKSVALARS